MSLIFNNFRTLLTYSLNNFQKTLIKLTLCYLSFSQVSKELPELFSPHQFFVFLLPPWVLNLQFFFLVEWYWPWLYCISSYLICICCQLKLFIGLGRGGNNRKRVTLTCNSVMCDKKKFIILILFNVHKLLLTCKIFRVV